MMECDPRAQIFEEAAPTRPGRDHQLFEQPCLARVDLEALGVDHGAEPILLTALRMDVEPPAEPAA